MRRARTIRDGNVLDLPWFFYPEAGTGIPASPVFASSPWAGGGLPSAGGPPELPARVTIEHDTAPKAVVTPKIAGTAHVIVAVTDNGEPSLTSYRRIILTIRAAANR